MRNQLLVFAAAISLQLPAAAAYFNYTLGNEYYTRAGWQYFAEGNYSYAYIDYHNFENIVTAYDYGIDQDGTTTAANCDGLCASSFPWAFGFNVTQPAHSVSLNASGNPGELDFYSLGWGCYAIGPKGKDSKGRKTYGRVARECTLTMTSKTKKGKALSQTFQFKPPKSPYTMQFAYLPSTWRNLTAIYFNATSKPSKDFPYPVEVGIDDLSYGIQNEPANG